MSKGSRKRTARMLGHGASYLAFVLVAVTIGVLVSAGILFVVFKYVVH